MSVFNRSRTSVRRETRTSCRGIPVSPKWPPRVAQHGNVFSRAGFALVAMLLGLLSAAPTARAEDYVTMPFACEIRGGAIRLTPAQDRQYLIHGLREQTSHTACGPNSTQCRTFNVHRFDFDCGGVRVPWVAAVASVAERKPWMAVLDDEQLSLQPSLRLAPIRPGEACSPGPGGARNKAGRRACIEIAHRVGGSRVTFPRGFAPALDLRPRFISDLPPPRALTIAAAPSLPLLPPPLPSPPGLSPVLLSPPISTRPQVDAEILEVPADGLSSAADSVSPAYAPPPPPVIQPAIIAREDEAPSPPARIIKAAAPLRIEAPPAAVREPARDAAAGLIRTTSPVPVKAPADPIAVSDASQRSLEKLPARQQPGSGWMTSILPSYDIPGLPSIAPLDPTTGGLAALLMLTGLLLSFAMVRGRAGRPAPAESGIHIEPVLEPVLEAAVLRSADPAAVDTAAFVPPVPPVPTEPSVPRSLTQALLVSAPDAVSPFDLPITPAEPAPIPHPMLAAVPPGDDAWVAVQGQYATAHELLGIVHQIVETLTPEGPMREVLRVDLHSIEQRLFSPQLKQQLAEQHTQPAGDTLRQILAELERARTISRIEHERAMSGTSRLGTAPETVEEAFAFLGVNPNADDRLVKKAVDALRQNWHPDQAANESDRLLREARIRQINAAWDLIRLAPTVA